MTCESNNEAEASDGAKYEDERVAATNSRRDEVHPSSIPQGVLEAWPSNNPKREGFGSEGADKRNVVDPNPRESGDLN